MVHIPVLLNEVMEILNPQPGEFFVDATIGEAGHSLEILKRLGSRGKLLGIDRDETMLILAKEKLQNFSNKIFVCGNYAELPEILKENNFSKADGLLLDLGFCSGHLESGRGFSFSGQEEPLLMIYGAQETPVKILLKKISEKELTQIIRNFGEERYAGRISRAIKQSRRPVETNKELAEIICRAAPPNYERGRIHPATRTFLALRIYANRELENLKKALNSLGDVLKPGGRISIVSFNSLEDRTVKQKFRELKQKNVLEILTKKPITPGSEEIKNNQRSRSAKLRGAIMKQG